MTTTHTPGPWKWARRYNEAGHPSAVLLETEHRPIAWNDPCVVAIREDWIDQFISDSPNARLIAAAPDLLAALESLTQLGTTPDGGIIIGPQGWSIARAAIGQAIGQGVSA